MGPPGAGKGTQARLISRRLGIPQISTGDILRQSVQDGTALGRKAHRYMERGELVPDEIVVRIVKERLEREDCRNGFILDGFPRNMPQAEALSRELQKTSRDIDWSINISVPDEEIMKRLSGRRVCLQCGETYNMYFSPPPRDELCGKCSTPLMQREDDKEETIRKRLQVYHEGTEPLIDYYTLNGKLITVDGSGAAEEISERIDKALKDSFG